MTISDNSYAPQAPMPIGMILRQERERRKIHMRELAECFGWSIPQLSDIEISRKEPTAEEMYKIMRWLNGDK